MKKLTKGQSLFEILLAIAIAAILITGVVSLATTSVRNSDSARDNALASRYAQQGVEWFRTERDSRVWTDGVDGFKDMVDDNDPGPMNFGSPPDWGTANNEIAGTKFTRTAEFVCFESDDVTNPITCGDDPVDLVRVTVNVSWTDSQGTHAVVSSTQLSSWQQ